MPNLTVKKRTRNILILITIFLQLSSNSLYAASDSKTLLENNIQTTLKKLPNYDFTAILQANSSSEQQNITFWSKINTFKVSSSTTSYFTPDYIYTESKIPNLSPYILTALKKAKIDINKVEYLRSDPASKNPGELLSQELVKFYTENLKTSNIKLTQVKNDFIYQVNPKDSYRITFNNDNILEKIVEKKSNKELVMLNIKFQPTLKTNNTNFSKYFDLQAFSTQKIFIDEKNKYLLTQELYPRVKKLVASQKNRQYDLTTIATLLAKEINLPLVSNKSINIIIPEANDKKYPYCATLVQTSTRAINIQVLEGSCKK